MAAHRNLRRVHLSRLRRERLRSVARDPREIKEPLLDCIMLPRIQLAHHPDPEEVLLQRKDARQGHRGVSGHFHQDAQPALLA